MKHLATNKNKLIDFLLAVCILISLLCGSMSPNCVYFACVFSLLHTIVSAVRDYVAGAMSLCD